MYKVTVKQDYSTVTVKFADYMDANMFMKLILDNSKNNIIIIELEEEKEGEK